MKDCPPKALVDLLASLGLATAAEVRGMAGRVRRLAGGLPHFESLWIDALAQARLLTTWQAVEIHAGRGPSLRVGPFVIFDSLARLGYATVFRAREIDGDRFVRLSIASNDVDLDDAERRLALLVQKADGLSVVPLVPLVQSGRDGQCLWAASEYFSGRPARQWTMAHGRMPPPQALEIARRMLEGLAVCERAGVVYSDVGADSLWFDARGHVRLPEPGLRGVLLPLEGGELGLPAEAYDSFAPERAANNSLCDARGDLFACGALWWHLLTGRPPFAGATAAAKLRSAQTAKLPDIRHLAPDTPDRLAGAILSCLSREPEKRPESLAALAAVLGGPTTQGQKRLARFLRQKSDFRRRFGPASSPWRRSPRTSTWVATAVGILLATTIITWPAISPRLEQLASDRPPGLCTLASETSRVPAPVVRADQNQGPRQFGSAAIAPEDEEHKPNELRSTNPVTQVNWQEPDDLLDVSAEDTPLDLSGLKSGQTLRGNPERRPSIEVPPEGIELRETDIRLENLDFIARQPLAPDAAMLTLRGLKTTLQGCSFQAADELSADELPPAIRWDRDVGPAEANADLSTGELQICDVTFRRVAVGVTCQLAGGMVVRFDNVLCLEAGPAVQFDRFPEADELALVGFSRVTLRGARSLVEVGCDQVPMSVGHLEVEAVDCAFVLPAAAALVVFAGEERPGALLRGLRWSGQGSVLSPRSRLAIWRMPSGRMLAAADEAVPIEGVVRGEVGFAGPIDDVPAGSRIVRWQAPLSSPRPPGIDDSTLCLPSAGE